MGAAVEGMRAQGDLLAGLLCALALGLPRETRALLELVGLKQAGETQALTLEGPRQVREMPAPVSVDLEDWPAELPALTGPEQIFAAVLVNLREPQAQADRTTKAHE